MTVTVNGIPLKEYVGEQIAVEIADVQISETRVPLARTRSTIHKSNTSGGRSSLGRVIWQAGQRETHVIIAGNMFDWRRKMPYVRSGHSILGAVEYDEIMDEVKCHDCGKWVKSISYHVAQSSRYSSVHSTLRNYRIRHGFRMRHSPLSTPSVSAVRKANAANQGPKAKAGRFGLHENRPNNNHQPGRCKADVIVQRRSLGNAPHAETANMVGGCKAQRLETLKEFAILLGHTPTIRELKLFEKDGRKPLYPTLLTKLFGVSTSKIIIQAGLQPNSYSVNPKFRQ